MYVAMPHADGYEAARRLSAIPEVGRKVTYIALTGFGQPNDFQCSKEAGFAHHLVKPVDPNELDQLLKEVLLGRGAGKHAFVHTSQYDFQGASLAPSISSPSYGLFA